MNKKKHVKSTKKSLSFVAKLENILIVCKKRWIVISLGLLFLVHVFFQFYNLVPWTQFGWDQTDTAWAAQKILINHQYPLVGMVAKEDTGFNIGPLYYYFISFFYFFTNMNPIASPIAASLVSCVTFVVFFFCFKKIISPAVALLICSIETFSFFIIWGDRVQWPVNFIPLVSVIIFYSLYIVICGKSKYILLLAISLGISLHIHFTSVLYFPIVVLAIPFFPKHKKTIWYGLVGIVIILLCISPILIANAQSHNNQVHSISTYIHSYYQGFHFRRFLQIAHDAFIEYILILQFNVVNYIYFLFLPLFSIIYYWRHRNKQATLLIYLCWLWILIPWIAFTTYSGELSNYYFYMTRPVVILSLGYLTYFLLIQRFILIKGIIIGFWLYFIYINATEFVHPPVWNFLKTEAIVKQRAAVHNSIPLYQLYPESYLFWYYSRVQ